MSTLVVSNPKQIRRETSFDRSGKSSSPTFERRNANVGDQRVQFVRRIFIFVALTRQANANSVRNVTERSQPMSNDEGGREQSDALLDALRPNFLVQFRIDAHVGCLHHFLGELFQFFHRTWRAFLEGTANEREKGEERRREERDERTRRVNVCEG